MEGNLGEGNGGMPHFAQGGFEPVGGRFEVDQEICMGTIETVLGSLRGKRKGFFHQANIEVKQKRTVKQQKAFSPTLGIARELQTADSQIRVTLFFHGSL